MKELEMTLRDELAAKCLGAVDVQAGEISISQACDQLGIAFGDYKYPYHYHALLAKNAYSLADAMLAERLK